MKCRFCARELTYHLIDETFACPSCQTVFPKEDQGWLSYYFSLRQQWENQRHIRGKIQSQMDQLKAKMLSIEKRFEPEVVAKEQAPAEVAEARSEMAAPIAGTQSTPQATPIATEPQTSRLPFKPKEIQWEKLFGFNLLLIAGVVFVLLGAAFFLAKVFTSGMLGPIGKLSFIYIGALATLGIGNGFRKKWPDFGLIIMGLAMVLMYIATFAGFQKYDLLPQIPAFLIMGVITLFTVVLSLIEDNKGLAILGLCGGFATPVMLSTGSGDFLVLQIYLCILNAGFLVLALKKQWNSLYYLSFVLTYLLYTASFEDTHFSLAILFLNLYFLTYSLYPFFIHLMTRFQEKTPSDQGALTVVFLNTALATGLNYELFQRHDFPIEAFAIITLSYAILFLGMTTYLYKKQEKKRSFYMMSFLAAAFIFMTIPVVFNRELVTILWFLLSYLLLRSSFKLKHAKLFGFVLVLHTFLALKLLLFDYGFVFDFYDDYQSDYYSLLFERWSTAGAALLFSLLMVRFHQKVYPEAPAQKLRSLVYHWILSIGFLFALSNIEVQAYAGEFWPQSGFVAISILWGLFALVMIYIGLKQNLSALRKTGITLFFLTFLKVFFIDISELDITFKFISFMVIGLFLILSSYLYRKFKDTFDVEGQPLET